MVTRAVVLQTYSLTVEASDGGGLTDTVTLTLTLTDVNDHTPQFSASTYTANLDENVSIGFTVFTVAATDNDSGVNGQVTYTITGLFLPLSGNTVQMHITLHHCRHYRTFLNEVFLISCVYRQTFIQRRQQTTHRETQTHR